MFGAISEGEQASEEFYEKWVAEVKATVPADRLLVFNVKQGWRPLCQFLVVPEPEHPFPHVNDSNQILGMLHKIRMGGYIVCFGQRTKKKG